MRYLSITRLFLAAFVCLTSCQSISQKFAAPANEWQTRVGQLAYRGPRMSLIGEIVVRYSKSGDFELTFSKGPGVTLLFLQQNARFANARGPLARGSWSGPSANAPARLRGWFALKDKIVAGGMAIHVSDGGENFDLRF